MFPLGGFCFANRERLRADPTRSISIVPEGVITIALAPSGKIERVTTVLLGGQREDKTFKREFSLHRITSCTVRLGILRHLQANIPPIPSSLLCGPPIPPSACPTICPLAKHQTKHAADRTHRARQSSCEGDADDPQGRNRAVQAVRPNPSFKQQVTDMVFALTSAALAGMQSPSGP